MLRIYKTVVFFFQEAFHCAKKAYRLYRSKVRSTLQITHSGPETLEEAVQNYINKNGQLLDVHSIVQVPRRQYIYNLHFQPQTHVQSTNTKIAVLFDHKV